MITFIGRALVGFSFFLAYWTLFFFWRCRKGLLPFWCGLAVWALGEWAFPLFVAWWVPATLTSVLAVLIYFLGPHYADTVRRARLYVNWRADDDGRPGVLGRDSERLYLCVFLIACGMWLSARYQNGPSELLTMVLHTGIFAFGAPWWYHHRYRTRKSMNKYAQRWGRISRSETRELKGWVNSKVVEVKGGRGMPVLVVRLTGGRNIKSVGGSSGNVASAFGLRPGAVTVTPDPKTEARVRVRIVPRDPWRRPLLHPMPEVGSRNLEDHPRVYVGKYEDASSVMFKVMQHMLVVGRSGSGKSVWLESLAAWLLAYTNARIVAADLASGATFDIWSDAFVVPCATTPESAHDLTARVFKEILHRERLLALRKRMGHLIDTLPTDELFPALFFFLDEFPDLIKAGGREVLLLLERLAAKGRKVNVWIVLGAQNPTAHDVGSTELRGQLTATIGLGLKEQQNRTLWGSQVQEGWNSVPLGQGEFLLQDPDHGEPRRAKGLWLPPEQRLEVIREASMAPRRLDPVSLGILCGVPEPAMAGGSGSLPEEGPFTVDMPELPAGGPAERTARGRLAEQDRAVLDALPREEGIGPADVMERTGLERDIVNRTLRRLEKSGQAERVGHGKWVRRG